VGALVRPSFRKPFFDFGGSDNSLRRHRIQRSGADLGAGRHLARGKPFGLGLAAKGLRTARIVSGLLILWKVNRNVPRFMIVLRHNRRVPLPTLSLISRDRSARGSWANLNTVRKIQGAVGIRALISARPKDSRPRPAIETPDRRGWSKESCNNPTAPWIPAASSPAPDTCRAPGGHPRADGRL
jgi:hypothetical protein